MGRGTGLSAGNGLVQVISVEWSKASRGGREARARNAVPHGAEVPAAHLADAGGRMAVTETYWGEQNSFSEPIRVRTERLSVTEGYTFGCVGVSAGADGLLVRCRYDPANGGAPDRRFFDRSTGCGEASEREVLVTAGGWARMQYNGRFSCVDSGAWWYQMVVVNVAWFEGDPDRGVFVASKPSQVLEMLAELW